MPSSSPRAPHGPAAERPALGPADRRLLAFLLRAGKLDPARTVEVETAPGGSLIERLEACGIMTEAAVATTLHERLRLPMLDLTAVELDERVLELLDEDTARAFAIAPLRIDEDALWIVIANPLDYEAIRRAEFASGLRTKVSVAPRSTILRAIEERHRRETALSAMLAGLPAATDLEIVGGGLAELSADADSLARATEEAPVVKMVHLILEEALRCGTSDVHVDPAPGQVSVRFRVNGVLEHALEMPKWLQAPVVARLKVMANLDISERRVPQDGRLSVRHEGRVVDVRVSSLPTSDGETIVLRLLDSTQAPWSLDAVGFGERDLAVIRRMIRKPQGMILVTGPTGSGKTTTLYAILKAIRSPERKIVTIENPIEYKLPGVSQVNVNEKQGLTFGKVLRAVLRQDPDVILVGEIRDQETAEVAFRAAQTGHLVLSTMHTNDTAATITRLLDVGIPPYMISASLVTVVAQRLVRTVCERCAQPASLSEDERLIYGLGDVTGLREGAGCPECRKTGFSARTGCYEVMEVTREIRDLISTRAGEADVRTRAEKQGMRTIRRDATLKIEHGITTPAEVGRVIDMDPGGARCPQCTHPAEEAFSNCPMCGTSLRRECPSCLKVLKEEWARCPYCSHALARADAAEGTADPARILVVDDGADNRRLVRAILQREAIPYEIEEATNGAEALAKIEEKRPSLVILDLMMPEMDGYEVCRHLRSNLRTALIPVLMMTAQAGEESRKLGYEAGTDDYVTKPFEPDELCTRVRWLLGLQRRPGATGGSARLRRSDPASAAKPQSTPVVRELGARARIAP
jgi:type IV pilus assembly protein PilB